MTGAAPLSLSPALAAPTLLDAKGRSKRKLRVSLTDRCNLRCHYCMPEKPRWLPRAELMTASELHRLVSLFVQQLGIQELRLTGGEPLLRPDLPDIIASLNDLRSRGLQRIALTSNGVRLAQAADHLHRAGLDDLNVSLDAVTPSVFHALTRGQIEPVLAGIAAAQSAGLPLKLNCVVIKGANDSEVLPLTQWAKARGLPLRFIEFMPLDANDSWRNDKVYTEAEIIDSLRQHYAVTALPRTSDPAQYYALDDEGYRLGVISTISKPFCSRCDRLRLDARGRLYTCLFSAEGRDLLSPLRSGASDAELLLLIRTAVWDKPAGYVEQPGYVERPITMHHLGG